MNHDQRLGTDVVHEARAVFSMMRRRILTLTEARELIAVSPTQRRELLRFLAEDKVQRAIETRERIAAEFERLVAAHKEPLSPERTESPRILRITDFVTKTASAAMGQRT